MSSVSRRIQVRRDTADNWTSVNPTLADGEIGYETTGFKRMKVGDGRTRWAALAYFNVGPTGRLGPAGPIGPNGVAANTGATGPTGVPGLSSGVTFQLNYTSAGPIVYSTVVSTLAGSSQGLVNEPGTVARFFNPSATAVDSSGTVYVADTANHVIRRITSAGVVNTFAGDGSPGFKDATGTGAQFNSPSAITITSAGILYVSDAGNHRIRRITSTGIVSTFAGSTSGFQDGIGTNARFDSPQGLVVDSLGNVFVADANNHRIRIITSSGQVSTFAGDGNSGTTDNSGTSARFNTPTGLAIDSAGILYVTDKNNHRIRKVTPQGGVSTLAGSTVGFTNNTGTAAQFSSPVGIAVDSTGTVYVADTGNHRIRTVSSTGAVTTFVGLSTSGSTNGTPTQAQFSSPYSVTVGTTGVLYVADYANHRIRKIVTTTFDPNEYVFTPFTGTLITPLNSFPTTSSYIVVPERKTDTHIATFTIPISGMPSTTSIVGQWVLGLNASVAVSSSPGSFYFEALDGTSSIVVGTSNRVAQTSSGVILATLTVPARTYSTSLTLKLFATTRDLSPMTIRFNGSTLSYLNTTIINVGPTGATGPHLFTIFNKLDHRVITSITDKSDELFANSNLTFNGSNLTVVNTVTTSNFRGQGTVSAPPYAFTTDASSGLFLPAVSNLALATVGTERVRILPSGNVGIATPTPGFTLDVSGTANVSGNLSVGTISTSGGGFSVPGNLTGGIIRTSSNGTAAVPAYTFSNDLTTGAFLAGVSNLALTTAGVERLRILPSGNVGIATPNPGFTLDVSGTANISGNLSVGTISTSGGGFSVPGNLTGGIIRSSSNGTAALPAYTFSNDLTTGAFLAGVSNLALTTAGVERLRIISNGNVGIAIAAPTEKLHVSGNAILTGTLSAGATTVTSLNAGSGSISNSGTLTTGAATVSSLGAGSGNITTTGNVFVNRLVSSGYGSAAEPVIGFEEMTIKDGIFRPGAGSLGISTAGNERIRISGTGKVGIGNQDPLHTLDVTGSARITSTLSAGDTTVTSLNATGGVSCIGLSAQSGNISTSGTVNANKILGSGSSYSTAGAPAFGFQEMDLVNLIIVNDGIFRPATGVLGISTYGVERMRIAANGNVGIGRADPSNTLDVNGTARITSNLSAGATTVTSLGAGSGSITTTGTLSAGATTVTSLDAGSGAITTTGSLSTGGATVTSLDAGTGNISNSGTLTTGAATVTSLNANSGTITTSSNLLTTNGSAGVPSHTFSGNTTVGMFSPGANSVAWTTTSTERMRILANGNVGIGTTNPTVLFDVNGATKTTTLSATSASITDVSLTTINGSKYSAGGGGTRLILSLQGSGTASTTTFSTAGGAYYVNDLCIDPSDNIFSGSFTDIIYTTLSTGGAPDALAGSGTRSSVDGIGPGATFNQPSGIVFYGGNLYVMEFGPPTKIRKVTLARNVTTFLSTGITSALKIAVDSAGNLYVPDIGSRTIKKVTPLAVVSTLAGSGTSGTTDGTGASATFTASMGAITIDWNGNVLVKDGTDGRIRRITPAGVVTTLNTSFVFETNPASPFLGVNGSILADNVNQVYYFGKSGIVKVTGGVGLTFTGVSPNGLVINSKGELYGGATAIVKYSFALTSSYSGTPITNAYLEKSHNPLSSLMTFTLNQAITNTHVFTFTMNNSQNAMTIGGEWTLQLFGRVSNAGLPASFYFEVLDGTNIVATGTPTTINTSTDNFFGATATVPGRTFSTNVNIKIYMTSQASSTLTILFNIQPSLSFLNTTLFSTGEIRDFYTSGLERMRITTNGFVGIGTTNPQQLLDVNGNVRAVAFPTASDRRLKTDIVTISDAVNLVKRLRGVYYTNIVDRQRAMGLIAQETEGVIPEVVYTSGDDFKSISYGNIVGVLVEAVKTLSERLETLEKKG